MRPKNIKELLENAKRNGAFHVPPDADEILQPAAGHVKPSEIVGLSKDAAILLIENRGMLCRITREDKEYFIGTADFRQDRLNLEIEKGKVVNAAIG